MLETATLDMEGILETLGAGLEIKKDILKSEAP